MGRVFGRFIADLIAGDPVALICAAILGGSAGVFGLVWWKIARDLHKEDEERKRRGRR